MKTVLIIMFVVLFVLAIIAIAVYRIIVRKYPPLGKYAKTAGKFMWKQSKAAPILAIIVVVLILGMIFWPSCDREEPSPVAAQQEQQYQQPSCQKTEPGVPLPQATNYSDIIREWETQGFQVVTKIILAQGEISQVFTCYSGEQLRWAQEPGKKVIVRRVNGEEAEVSNKDHYDMGSEPQSIVFVGVEPSIEVTILKK